MKENKLSIKDGENYITGKNESKNIFKDVFTEMRTSKSGRFGKGIGYQKGASSSSGVLYAAAGPYTSRKYGTTMLSMQFENNTKIFPLFSVKNSSEDEWMDAVFEKEEKSLDKYSDIILKCSDNKDLKDYKIENLNDLSSALKYGYRVFIKDALRKLALFIFEDHNIDTIHYASKKDWFQILQSDKIEALDVTKMQQYDWAKNATLEQLIDEHEIVNEALIKDGKEDEILENGKIKNFSTKEFIKKLTSLKFNEEIELIK